MPKVIFKVPSYEFMAKKVFFAIKDKGEEYREIIYIKIPKYLIEEISKNEFENVKDKLIEEVKKHHDLEKLEKFRKELEEYWSPLNNIFFDGLKKITGFDFKYDEYFVYVSTIRRGSYTLTNIVFTNLLERIKTSAFIAAEELFHLHYWNIFRKTIKDSEIPWRINNYIWEISEVVPEFVLTDNLFNPFGWGKDLHRNYPFIEKWKEKLKPIWENKKNFKEFMIKIHRKPMEKES